MSTKGRVEGPAQVCLESLLGDIERGSGKNEAETAASSAFLGSLRVATARKATEVAKEPPLDVLDGYGDEAYLGVVFDGQAAESHLEVLEEFWENRALTHEEAKRFLVDVIRRRFPFKVSELDPELALKSASDLYSLQATGDLDDAVETLRTGVDMIIHSAWVRQEWYRVFFGLNPRFAAEYAKAAVKCPRALRDEDDNMKGDEGMARDALKYLIMQPELERNAFVKAVETEEPNAEGVLTRSPKRAAYFMGLLAGKAAYALHNSMGSDRRYPSPSMRVLGQKQKEETVRKYLDALLSLLLSYDYISQSDLITKDVEAILDFYEAKYALRKEYQPILSGLKVARALQCFAFGKDKPGLTRSPLEHDGWAPSRTADHLKRSSREGPLNHLDIGCGKCPILGQVLSQRGLVAKSFGVDVFSSDKDTVEREDIGGVSVLRFNDKVFNDAQILQAIEKAFDGELLHWVSFYDSLHHIDDNSRMAYLRTAYDLLCNGGVLEIFEPVHPEALDKLSAVYVHPLDTNREKHNDTKMVSMEDLGWTITYLALRAAKLKRVDIIPGVFAGNEDSYYRIHLIVTKPQGDKSSLPYFVPDAPEGTLSDSEDIFKVFPFSLIKESDSNARKMALDFIKELGFEVEGVEFEDFRKKLICMMMNSEQQPDQYNEVVMKNAPLRPEFVDELLRRVGEDEEMRKRVFVAGEVLLIMRKLKENGLDLEASLYMEYQHAWGNVALASPDFAA